MFFLLYVPTIRQRMSREQVELLATQLAEQVLSQTIESEEEKTPAAREAVRSQLLEMMMSLQEQYSQRPDVEYAEAQVAEAQQAPESPEIAHMRDFLERCFKQSA